MTQPEQQLSLAFADWWEAVGNSPEDVCFGKISVVLEGTSDISRDMKSSLPNNCRAILMEFLTFMAGDDAPADTSVEVEVSSHDSSEYQSIN